MRVCVRGITYDSVPEASRALGVSEKTVYSALSTGTEDTLGIGRGRHGKTPPGPRAVAIQLGPRQYASIRQASRELGFSRKKLTRWLRNRGVETSPARLCDSVTEGDQA